MIDFTQVDELHIGGKGVHELYINGNIAWRETLYGMKFTALQSSSTIQIGAVGSPPSVDLKFSVNGGVLNSYTIGNTVSLTNVGDSVLFVAGQNGNQTFSTGSSNYYVVTTTGSFSSQGTIAYLLEDDAGGSAGVTIPEYGFYRFFYDNTPSITSLDMSNVVSIGRRGMHSICRACTSLVSVDLSSVTSLSEQALRTAFDGCTSLTSIDLSSLSSATGNESMYYLVRGCTALETVYLNKLSSVGTNGLNGAFSGCTALEVVDFSEATAVPEITTTTFSSTNSTFQIVVPDSLYSTWIAATNWSSLASQIVKVSDYTPAS